LLLLLVCAAGATGILMFDMFQQSATAQTGRAQVEIEQACDAIAGTYRFYTSGWHEKNPDLADASFRRDLNAVVQSALHDRSGIEGGIWHENAGSLAYAFPTYQGAGPKTDFPAAELARVKGISDAALSEDRPKVNRYDMASQIMLISACPLRGPVPRMTAWTMTRMHPFSGGSYVQLMSGLGILLATVLAAAVLLTHLTVMWTRHVGKIEQALAAHDIAALPVLQTTGEKELDRIIAALNEAGPRLTKAKEREEQLAREVAASQRLATIGHLTAGIAHEIRNPIGAMKLKAENAIDGDLNRKDSALAAILQQVDRLDGLLRRLLSMTENDKPERSITNLVSFLESCIAPYVELAQSRQISWEISANEVSAYFDPVQTTRAMDNLILNALQAAPDNSSIKVTATRHEKDLIFSVQDAGAGPPDHIREHLFEPFVTGRADGTGLGLSIVREIAKAQDGDVRFGQAEHGTLFEIILPWLPY